MNTLAFVGGRTKDLRPESAAKCESWVRPRQPAEAGNNPDRMPGEPRGGQWVLDFRPVQERAAGTHAEVTNLYSEEFLWRSGIGHR